MALEVSASTPNDPEIGFCTSMASWLMGSRILVGIVGGDTVSRFGTRGCVIDDGELETLDLSRAMGLAIVSLSESESSHSPGMGLDLPSSCGGEFVIALMYMLSASS